MKNKVIRKIILYIIQFCCLIFILNSSFGCFDKEGDADLTVINNSSLNLEKLTWRSASFGNVAPGDTVSITVKGIKDTKVFFDFYLGSTEYFTDEEIQVDPGSRVTFTFTDDTKIKTFK